MDAGSVMGVVPVVAMVGVVAVWVAAGWADWVVACRKAAAAAMAPATA